MCWRWLGSPLRCSLRASDLLDRFLKPTPLDDDRFAIESSAVSFEPPQKRRRNSATDPDEFELIDSVRSLTSAAASVIAELRMAMTQTASDVPAAVGVPEITPVAEFRARPAGSVPEDMDHVLGVVPPLAARVCE